jgi:hypothetical protein
VHPEGFDEDRFGAAWSLWVLAHGLPELPGPQIAVGESVPVAYWIGPRTAAVLHIRRVEDDDGPEPYAETNLDLFYLLDGVWELCGGGGGGGWSGDALARRQVPTRSVYLGSAVGGWAGDHGVKALWGQLGSDAAFAEVEQSGQVIQQHIEAPTGFAVFSAEYDLPFTVRVFDSGGELLAEIDEAAGWDDDPPWCRGVR